MINGKTEHMYAKEGSSFKKVRVFISYVSIAPKQKSMVKFLKKVKIVRNLVVSTGNSNDSDYIYAQERISPW